MKEEVKKEKDKLKDKEKSLRTSEIAQKEETQAVEALIVEGSKRLANAIAKHDFKEAGVASVLIGGARKTEGDQHIKIRKDIEERKEKNDKTVCQRHRKKPKSRSVFCRS